MDQGRKIIDTHAHLHMPHFKADFRDVLTRTAQLHFVLNVSTSLQDMEPCISISNSLPNTYVAIGIHPHDSKEAHEIGTKYLDILEEKATKINRIIAIGEIGLDYFRNISPVDIQKKVFADQLALALELHLPVILHIRDAYEDTYDILKAFSSEDLKGIVHAFGADETWAKRFVKLGFKLGIGGPITYPKNEMLRNVVKIIGRENIVPETDCPYLPPQQYRGKRNEPIYVSYVYDELERIFGSDVSETMWSNVKEIFRDIISDKLFKVEQQEPLGDDAK
ncbi:TatD family hydrolase [Fervidobacterium islandicum]|uniref:TatD family hydrolase n=1 Tax=Fervidobacterium islandicum TaxID=2423 RepID=A0AAI8GCV2_FERIS|nr:TatD family hydrolase [Fervidobacterium islandicum]AMW32693.1 TatD family hydrolase [Fervidobacterium islandicum]